MVLGVPTALGALFGEKQRPWPAKHLLDEGSKGGGGTTARVDPNAVRNMVLLDSAGQATLVRATRNEVVSRMSITQRDFRLVDPWVRFEAPADRVPILTAGQLGTQHCASSTMLVAS
jgi:hypothetical protein